jgi:PAS domain S-box-containing protein
MPNRAVLQTPAPKLLPEHLDASEALREGQFVPFFQPLVTLRTGQLAGFEMLARWQHPLEGMIPPDMFIAVAERDGWIEELTHQLLQKAFSAAATAIPDPLTLAVNISPVQLRDVSLPEHIRLLAAEANFPLSRVVIEITESALIDSLQSAVAVVGELKKMGCRLALDDFGTGYSSLSHLQVLPFDKLKVDRSFVSSMTESRESRKIVSAVVGLGQSLGLTTVAEGIETQEQAEMMLWLGCDLGQGYFYGRPLPVEALLACVSEKRERLSINPGSAWRKISAGNVDSSPAQRLAQLQAVYDGAPVGLAFIDQNSRYVNLNQRLADMNGARIEDHLGNTVSEMIPELFPYVEPYIRRTLNGESVMNVEVHSPQACQTRLLSYQPARDEAGEVIGASLSVQDITDRKRMEEALRASEAHYRSMVELNPQVLWIMDPMGRNLDVSPRWDKVTGLLKSQSTEHEWLKSVHPEDIQPTVRAIANSRRDGCEIDVRYRVFDGEHVRWKRSRGAPRFDADGNIVCWYGSVEDIEAPREQNKPTPSDRLSKSAVSGIHAVNSPLASTDQKKRSQVLSDLEILDTPPEAEFDDLVSLASEICGTPISLISLIDSDRQWFKAAVGLAASQTSIISSFCAHAIAQQGPLIVPDAMKDKRFKKNALVLGDPHIRFYAGIPLYAGDGVAIGTLCVIDTVPRALSASQTKALTILSHQVQARIELRSERKKQLKEIEAKQELATRLEEKNEILKDANHKLEQLFSELEQTRLQHMEDELELRKRSELDTLKNEYVAMVSHELRSPLTSVRGAVGILSAGLADSRTDKGAKLFHIALRNLDRMIRLVNDVLNLERLASGPGSLHMQRCLLGELVQQAVETMTPIAEELNVRLIDNASTLTCDPMISFRGDADKTLQVLINLLSNAITFSPAGAQVKVDIALNTDTFTIKISDHGRGIPEDQLEKVFERFQQVERNDARRLGGTGLGLAICRTIVEQHGGAIWAERNAEKGTSFFVTLPYSPNGQSREERANIPQPPHETKVA